MKTEIIRSHCTDDPELFPCSFVQGSRDGLGKPNGLWYQINGSWEQWVEDSMRRWRSRYRIVLDIDFSKVAKIQTLPELLTFHVLFKKKKYFLEMIDWKAVTEEFTGIEIINVYALSHALLNIDPCMNWLYGWAVDSGCVWDWNILSQVKTIDCQTDTVTRIFTKNT